MGALNASASSVLEDIEFIEAFASLKSLKGDYVGSLRQDNLRDLVNDVKAWRNENTYLIFGNRAENKVAFSRAAKRGNSIYTKRLEDNINRDLWYFAEPEFCNSLVVRSADGSNDIDFMNSKYCSLTSNTFFITATVDPKKHDLNSAWANISEEYNRFVTRLKNNGIIPYRIKVFESHKGDKHKGFPHTHFLLIVEKPLKVVKYQFSGGDWGFILDKKDVASNDFYNLIKESWRFGNSDIKPVYPGKLDENGNFIDYGEENFTGQDVLNYLYKELFKAPFSSAKDRDFNDELTLSLLTIHNKRAYSISGDHVLFNVAASSQIPFQMLLRLFVNALNRHNSGVKRYNANVYFKRAGKRFQGLKYVKKFNELKESLDVEFILDELQKISLRGFKDINNEVFLVDLAYELHLNLNAVKRLVEGFGPDSLALLGVKHNSINLSENIPDISLNSGYVFVGVGNLSFKNCKIPYFLELPESFCRCDPYIDNLLTKKYYELDSEAADVSAFEKDVEIWGRRYDLGDNKINVSDDYIF